MNRIEPCESFQLLISAALDGELDEREQVELDRHLSACGACRHWQASIVQQEQLLLTIADEDSQADLSELPLGQSDSAVGVPLTVEFKSPQAMSQRRGLSWRLVGVSGLAAAVLLGVGLIVSALVRQQGPAPTFSVEPVAAMHAINVQSEEDQHAILRTVELDLRAMKLELKRMSLDDAARDQLGTQIDSLLAKTRQLQPTTPVSFQGE
jgi:anti-sigma factor RsiW